MSHLLQVFPGYYMLSINRAVAVRDVPPHFKIIDQVAQIYQSALHVSVTTVNTVDYVFGRRQSFGQRCTRRRIFGDAKDIRTRLWDSQHTYNMIYTTCVFVGWSSFRRTSARCDVPCWLQQLGCEWNAIQPDADAQKYWVGWALAMFSHSLAYFYLVKYHIFCLQVYGNLEEENRMYQRLKKIYSEKVCRIKFLRTNLGKYGQNILCTPKILPAPTQETSASFLATMNEKWSNIE